MSNSNLVTYTKLSPNCTKPRNHAIDTITIHCFVGQVTAESGCNIKGFVKYNSISGHSCNYVVGCDGSIGLCVDEANRSWCSSNRANDHRAITIEVASKTKEPYAITDKAYKALLDLVTDICKRNNIKKLVWSTNKTDRVNHKNGCNMTVHRDFANKSCPGTYLYNKHAEIAAEVNKRLGVVEPKKETVKAFEPYKVKVTASSLNIRKGAGTNYGKNGKITDKGIYTIIDEASGKGAKKWGKLKSGAGWISLDYCKKI